MTERKDAIFVAGSRGLIGRASVDAVAGSYNVVRFELPLSSRFEQMDLTSDESVRLDLKRVRERFGDRTASVVHLAAYFDITGEPNPKYEHEESLSFVMGRQRAANYGRHRRWR
jgi:nucleoside-diphosphate-sugar epimerase